VSTVGPEHHSGARRVEVEAIVATDQPLAAYGGIRVDESMLHDIAEAVRSGSLPMLIGHDIRRPLNPTVLDAQVRQNSDGYKEVWIRFTVDADAWAQFEEELAASGAPGGFSFAASEPIYLHSPPSRWPQLRLRQTPLTGLTRTCSRQLRTFELSDLCTLEGATSSLLNR
jgi:hypothetical protein